MRDTSIYKDINQFTPITREYSTDAQAVFQSVLNVIRTSFMEIPFTTYGINIEEYLFDLDDAGSRHDILMAISTAVEETERRVKIDSSSSNIEFDGDSHKLTVNFYFTIEGIEGQKFQILESIELNE